MKGNEVQCGSTWLNEGRGAEGRRTEGATTKDAQRDTAKGAAATHGIGWGDIAALL